MKLASHCNNPATKCTELRGFGAKGATIWTTDLFLAQKIDVRVTAGAGVDDSGKVPRKIVSPTEVKPRKGKRHFQNVAKEVRQPNLET